MTASPNASSIHTDEMLLSQFMEPLGLSADRRAKNLHISDPRVNGIIRGNRGIPAHTALRLALYFGNSAPFWINLQSCHDL